MPFVAMTSLILQVDPAGKFQCLPTVLVYNRRPVSWLQHDIPEGEPGALPDADPGRVMGD